MILVYLLVSILPFMRHPLWSQYVGDVTAIKYVGAACLAYAVIYRLRRRTAPAYLGTPQARWFLLFFCATMVSALSHGSLLTEYNMAVTSFTSYLILFWVVLTVVDSRQRLRWTLLVAIGAVAYVSLHGLREWEKSAGMIRPGWVAGDANYFAASALLCLPLAFYLLRGRRPGWESVFCFGSIVIALLATIVSASRGGFVGLMAAGGLVVLRDGRRFRKIAILTAAMLLLALVPSVSPVTRLLAPTASDERAATSRTEVWVIGLRMFASNPVLGVGPGTFKSSMRQYAGQIDVLADGASAHVAHNMFVEILAETGALGFLPFLFMQISMFMSLERTRRRAMASGSALLSNVALGLEAGMLGFLVAAFFVSAQYLKLYWFMLFLTMAMPALVSRASAVGVIAGDRRVPSGHSRSRRLSGNHREGDVSPSTQTSQAGRSRAEVDLGYNEVERERIQSARLVRDEPAISNAIEPKSQIVQEFEDASRKVPERSANVS